MSYGMLLQKHQILPPRACLPLPLRTAACRARCRPHHQVHASSQDTAAGSSGVADGESVETYQEPKIITLETITKAAELAKYLVFEDDEDSDAEDDRWEFEHMLDRITPLEVGEEATLPVPDFRPSADLSKIPAVTSAYSSEGGFEEVGAAQLEQMMAQQRGQQQDAHQLVVLDVRLTEEYAAGHIPGSLNIPLEELSAAVKAGQLEQHRAAQIAVVGDDSMRGAQAAVRLKKVLGFPAVVHVKGGVPEWCRLALPTATR